MNRTHYKAAAVATVLALTACSPNGDNHVDPLDEQLAAWEAAVQGLEDVSKVSARGPAGASTMSASISFWYPEGTDVDSDDISEVIAAVTDATDPDFYDWYITVSPGLEAPQEETGVTLIDLSDLVDDPDYIPGTEYSIKMRGDGTPLLDTSDNA